MADLTIPLAGLFVNRQGPNLSIPTIFTTVAPYAFFDSRLTSVDIGDGISYIGDGAFYLNQIETIFLGDQLIVIGKGAFAFNNLISVSIPSGVTVLGDGAFAHNDLLSVEIPTGILSIPTSAFADNDLVTVLLHDDIFSIGDSSFAENDLNNIDIPNSVVSIGNSAFYSNQLKTVNIPNSVADIGVAAFSDNKLSSVLLGSSVSSIGDYAFFNNLLIDIDIPDSVLSVGKNAFAGNPLEKVTISADESFDLSVFPEGVLIDRRNINDSPVDTFISFLDFDESVSPGSVVATLSTKDPDLNDTFVYTLVPGIGDADNSIFAIEDDRLIINHKPDFESKSSYLIRLQTRDSGYLTFEKAFTISLNDLADGLVDIDGNGFVDDVQHYQIWTETGGIDLQTKHGRRFSDNSSPQWDAIKAVVDDLEEEDSTAFMVLLAGERRREDQYQVLTTNQLGVIESVTPWMTGSEMFHRGYEEIFEIDLNKNGLIDLP